jgi:hypothetical protein
MRQVDESTSTASLLSHPLPESFAGFPQIFLASSSTSPFLSLVYYHLPLKTEFLAQSFDRRRGWCEFERMSMIIIHLSQRILCT